MQNGVVRAHVAAEIVIPVDDLSPTFFEQIKQALSIPNEEKQKQAALKIWGHWDLPDVIELFRVEDRRGLSNVLCLPRGFAAQLVLGAQHNGVELQWEDKRTTALAAPGYFKPFLLRDYQFRDAKMMLASEQGVYRCPAGGGKTVTLLSLMAYAQQRAIVIVDKAFLLEQWRERAAQFLGLSLDLNDERSVGKIGENVWEERELTICLRQTLFSRLWETKATRWFDRIGLAVLDEVHHTGSAETLQEVVRSISSKMLLGPSATPARNETEGRVVGALVGPIVAETTRQELYDRGVLVRPHLEIVDTNFYADFWPTHDSLPDGSCKKPDCYKKIPHSHNHNYPTCLKKLVEDEERNILIAETVISQRGHVHLIPSSQLKHLNLIKRALEAEGWDGPIYFLRGEENARGDSQKIVKAIEAGGHWEPPPEVKKLRKKKIEELRAEAKEKGEEFIDPNDRLWVQTAPIGEHGHEAVILSTVAGEGMDVPMIDRLHHVFPGKQEAALIQVIGRCERVSPNKTEAIIYDYRDAGCDVFREHASERLRVYRYQSLSEEKV